MSPIFYRKPRPHRAGGAARRNAPNKRGLTVYFGAWPLAPAY